MVRTSGGRERKDRRLPACLSAFPHVPCCLSPWLLFCLGAFVHQCIRAFLCAFLPSCLPALRDSASHPRMRGHFCVPSCLSAFVHFRIPASVHFWCAFLPSCLIAL